MRKVNVSPHVWEEIHELFFFLRYELHLSEDAAHKRIDRIIQFIEQALSAPVTHQLCRYRPWRELGYRCVSFEKSWVFAYELFDDGVLIRDMRHGALLK